MGSFAATGPTPMIDGWQPAETAPKDGTQVLGMNNRGNFAVIFWNDRAQYPGWAHPFTSLEPSSFWNGSCGSTLQYWQRMIWPPEICAKQFMYFAEVILRGQPETCGFCEGEGVYGQNERTCPRCDGRGQIDGMSPFHSSNRPASEQSTTKLNDGAS